MSEWWDPVEVKEKKKRISASGVRNAASSLLGLISIISALIALSITISFYDYLHDLGAGWVFGFFLFVVPLMIFSFALSMIGIVLSSGTREGKRLCKIGLILTFSPILMLFIMYWMQDRKKFSYVDEVQFNKEKTVLIDYSENKKETNYTIPDSVTRIFNNAFQKCTSLTGVTIPDSVNIIGGGAFNRCSSLTSISIGDSVTSIERSAFWKCISLKSIRIPNSVITIGDNAFLDCASLTSITIPDSVTSIGYNAFGGCKKLITVTFLGDAPKEGPDVFKGATPTIYRKPDAKGWSDTFAGRPVKLISEKPNNP
jgi:hypothetical protein